MKKERKKGRQDAPKAAEAKEARTQDADATPEAQTNGTTPGDSAEPAAESPAPPTVAGLQGQLEAANDRFLRAKAEHDNYRKRMQREMGEIRDHMKLVTVQEFLPVFDCFQMAMQHTDQTADVETLKQGMQMIDAEFKRTLEGLGVAPFDAVGEAFDPNEHEAVVQEPSDKVPEGKIVRQWKCGFRVGDRLLRAAAVVVSSGPPDAEEPETGEAAEGTAASDAAS